MGVNHKTVKAAISLLENEGIIVNKGRGLRREIVSSKSDKQSKLKVAILCHDKTSKGEQFLIDLYHQLDQAGHLPFYASKSLHELKMNYKNVARLVNKTEADAWIVCAAPREILNWFTSQPIPAFSIFGQRIGVPIAGSGPDKAAPIAEATRKLIELGHSRISFICRRPARLPRRAVAVQAFLDELSACGIAIGDYNLPDWEMGIEGFFTCLDALFKVTRPTALILDESFLYNPCYHYVSQLGLRVPQDISLVCTDFGESFSWCRPAVSHISWSYAPMIRRVIRWTKNISQGKQDLIQDFINADFIEGGTIGPVSDKLYRLRATHFCPLRLCDSA